MLYIAALRTKGIKASGKELNSGILASRERISGTFQVREHGLLNQKIHIANIKILNNGKRRSNLLSEVRTGTLG